MIKFFFNVFFFRGVLIMVKFYKMVLLVVLFLSFLGLVFMSGVSAADPNNVTVDGGLNPVNPTINNTTDVVKIVNSVVGSELEKRDIIIQNQDLRIKNLENSSAEKDIRINALNNTINSQSVAINSLKDDNKVLTDRVQALEYSKLTQSNRIKSLEIDIKTLENSNKQLIDSNKALNVKIDNQNSIINELNNKLDLKSIEINTLQADKDKLNAEINKLKDEKCTIYEKLLESPKKEDYEQLKKDITNKNNKIKELTIKINKLNSLLSVSGNDVVNSLKHLSSTKNIKCGQYTFKLDDYLKIPLIKYGKDRVLKYKKTHGRLPNYVTIAGYEVPKNLYKKLYNMK